MIITWNPGWTGDVRWRVSDEAVMIQVEALIKLGFEPTLEMED